MPLAKATCFGYSVAISGDSIVVGAPFPQVGTPELGRVGVCVRAVRKHVGATAGA